MSSKSSKAGNTEEVLGTGAKAAPDGDLAKAAKPEGEISPDATLPGVQQADTTGAHAPDDTPEGDS